ncbi:hypothetical protein FEM48_Zijuj01G0179400 [Ziziphus jujuba var. spinosa]|uniref:G-patch domain-containing protein n=1 Tax=Ziziphus jujuba var. spinosa TaxID=714518 RepID=A0A978W2Q6_ZIZJJ|nr:hypothetical protein FEM48_Zijuj01G0179400 [Ziziphus jujuba var. spinosa]
MPSSLAEIELPYFTTEITSPSSPFALSLAKHLQSIGAKMYGAFWYSHYLEQKQTFGSEATKLLNYVECFPDGYKKGTKILKACADAGIEGFPTWVINEQVLSGEQELSDLAQASGKKPGVNKESGSKSRSFDRTIAACTSKNAPRKSSENHFGYRYPSVDLQGGLHPGSHVERNDKNNNFDESRPFVLVDSKEAQIFAYVDKTPSSRPNDVEITYDYGSNLILGDSSHRGLGFSDKLEGTPSGVEASAEQMKEQEESCFDSSSSEKEMNTEERSNHELGVNVTEDLPAITVSPKKNSGFVSIGGMKLYTQDISDEESDDDGDEDEEEEMVDGESSESSGQGGTSGSSESDDSEDMSDSDLDVDDQVAEDYIEGIGGSHNIVKAKWLVEQEFDESDDDTSSSTDYDDTLEKLGGVTLQEASREYGMKKAHPRQKYKVSTVDSWSLAMDDLTLVKDPRAVHPKKKHVARFPQSWPSEAYRSKTSRRFPGIRYGDWQEFIACEVAFKVLARKVTRTPHTCMPSSGDRLRLEKLLGAGMEDADFAVAESSNIKSDSADKKRSKKFVKGSGLSPSGLESAPRKTSKISTSRRGSGRVNEFKKTGKKDSYANQPVSFVSSGVMQETVKIMTVDSVEMDSGCKNDNSAGPADIGAFEVHTKGFGSKMMAKMGFVEGGGLGIEGQGIAQPIEVIKRPKSLGLGVEFSDAADNGTRSNPVRNKSQTIGAFEKHTKRTRSDPGQKIGAFEKHTKGFGSKMMAKMGFVEGMGLGKDSQGRANPLVAVRLPKSRGLGAEG